MNKQELLEKLKEAQEAIKAFQNQHRSHWLNPTFRNYIKSSAFLIEKLGGAKANKYQKVKITTPEPIPQPRMVEPEPEQGKILANNAETPDAKQEQKKKRRRGRPKKNAE